MHRAYIGRIRPGKEQEYIDAHKAVWPELIEAMKRAGVRKESCFLFENIVFVYVEAEHMAVTMDKLARDPINQKWDLFMEPLLESPSTSSSELFPEMQEVFRM